MLHLILADSELETVPPEISSEKSIRWKAQRRGRKPTELILDSNYDHRIMRKLPDSERRGRPDIIHVCMLAALDSPLNREDLLKLYIHTRNDKIIDVASETRIPRSYNRFIGLIEQLFLTGEVPPEGPLLRLRDGTLRGIVEEINPEKAITFSSREQEFRRESLFDEVKKEDDVCIIVGGFPHGDFLSRVGELSDEIVRIYPEEFEALTAVTHAIHFYEDEFEVLKGSFNK
ncbi:hypothetical protein AKJ44_00550 [candidate division MSBL1 archaeon SCGC-AAA261F17]|uniref:Ribosomal RNA small subunit methyltransferase Nep1 n=1 Tax=candidate division MSBL1 archaeon SCGC-AAA261F17 TaxID=1698274 RepID=A0A133V7F3_9EURY|nr:hypothetical protein AKJ44_00550 [candidate division MSBL1 archaeon SCGC-AAA261F17]